ncbi:MAG TPA: SDR family NAD(P)-dependent oxidoreductase, partial [Pseudonocardiaceae bacterium]|nr:SDR family NAD(P)-dependent oxidoreductase [Pseudonocardiaceae bacterium]
MPLDRGQSGPGVVMAGRTQEMVDRVVVITGASRGVGELLAESFSAAGASLGLLARDEAAIKELADRVTEPAVAVACDVADEDAVTEAFAQLADRLGRIDSVVANAGIAPGSGRAHTLDADMWRSVVDVNLTGSFLTARAAYPYLAASGWGRLVLTSSVMASLPRRGIAAYAASKAGIEGLTRALATDWATDGITVNAVAPGFFDVG